MLMQVSVLLGVPVLAWAALYQVVRVRVWVRLQVLWVMLLLASAVWCPEAPVRVWVRLPVPPVTRLPVWVVR
ncbi:hypothetical protein EBN03_29100 [Nocardia stercoris]|uniref:Uncharacterized protein n=1 Tax=Nocardia stercoris TaxID=2483361 RepID=A0A3M2KWR7_9NOCA|nr:hypothetical protein EBN03_29100 [Nocardia stercoris]